MDTFNDIWKEVLQICKNQVSDVMYNMWLAPLEFVKFENDTDTVVFLIGAEFKKSIIMDKFGQMIRDGFEQILGFPVEIDILVDKTLGDIKSGGSDPKEEEEYPQNKNNPFASFTFAASWSIGMLAIHFFALSIVFIVCYNLIDNILLKLPWFLF